MKPPAIQIIEQARKLIEDKDNWFGGDSRQASWAYPDRLCAILALDRVCMNVFGYHIEDSQNILPYFGMDVGQLVKFNNDHTHKEVLALFDKVLKNA